MPENSQGPLSPDFEDLLAFRLARKVLITIAAMLTPVVLLLGWLGYDRYADLQAAFNRNTALLDRTTLETRARADSLKLLTTQLEWVLAQQTQRLTSFDKDADASRVRLQEFYSRVTDQAADDRVRLIGQVNRAVSEADALASRVDTAASHAESAAAVAHNAGAQLEQLQRDYGQTHQAATEALTLAREAAVQTVGARQRRHLYGTPFDVYFSGVSGNTLRDFMIADEDGETRRSVVRQPVNEVIRVDDSAGRTYLLSIVNVIDVPGGLFRLNGSSRADAATFRVSRADAAPGGRLTSTPPRRD
jgi:hypothetical protein